MVAHKTGIPMESNTENLNPEANPEQKEKKKGKKQIQLERTRTAFERLQLAWVRTSLTMLTIGVGSYEYFYNRLEKGQAPLLNLITGRELGLFLILTAFSMLLFATVQHTKNMSSLKKTYPEMRFSVALVLSYLLLALSFFLGFMVSIKYGYHVNV
ncbi:MAG: DUF202 domain-containing protein [Cyclobacteriaceae bacterium]|nr:DUF202 domain-containing protein [Cyclobacteriaceae bacterium]